MDIGIYNILLLILFVAGIILEIALIVKFWKACNNISKINNKLNPNSIEHYILGDIDIATESALKELATKLAPYVKSRLTKEEAEAIEQHIKRTKFVLNRMKTQDKLPHHLESAEKFVIYIGAVISKEAYLMEDPQSNNNDY